ncbi:hypothetical protein ACFV3F_43310 [Streptomyces sp. NPDC059717]|uniref:hypothetical protein n=1 Tax=Streptomyces sp. NPDC059717 TaxID=3346922 RepID=UPI003680B231
MTRTTLRRPAWFSRPAPRLLFQHRIASTGLAVRPVRPPRALRGGFALAVDVRDPDLPEQTVTIAFGPGWPDTPHVFSDGPRQSPHRYTDGSLCMWYPGDPPEQRWDRRRDGSIVLLGLVLAHLLREEWWRRTGEWAGPEAPHTTTATASALEAAA